MGGDTDKATQLFLRHYNFVLGLACRYAPFPGIAEDILHDVFVEFVQHADRWNPDEDVKPVLVRLTRFAVAARWREHLKHAPPALRKIAEHLKSIADTTAEPVDGDELLLLKHCLDKLPRKSRDVIEMHYKSGISMVEIARKMSVKDSAVRQAVCRIRNTLRRCMMMIQRGET